MQGRACNRTGRRRVRGWRHTCLRKARGWVSCSWGWRHAKPHPQSQAARPKIRRYGLNFPAMGWDGTPVRFTALPAGPVVTRESYRRGQAADKLVLVPGTRYGYDFVVIRHPLCHPTKVPYQVRYRYRVPVRYGCRRFVRSTCTVYGYHVYILGWPS